MQLTVQGPVQEQINDALFPGWNVESPPLTIEVKFETSCRSKAEGFIVQGTMDAIQTADTASSQVVQRLSVSGSVQSFTPLEQRFRVHANGGFVELGFAINMPPAQEVSRIAHWFGKHSGRSHSSTTAR